MHSLHFVLVLTWEKPDSPECLPFTDGAEARAVYEEFRDDPGTKHARLYHNPTPNGGVYDSAPPQLLPDLPESAYAPGSKPIPPLPPEGDPEE